MKADLRSDTITKPTPAMLEAMAAADVGDDCYGDDPSVNELQEQCASLFGKEAALFTCSGTMSNQIALRAHTRPGDEIILDYNYHINFFESAASANLAQTVLNPVKTRDGILSSGAIADAIDAKPRGPLYSKPRLVCLENTIAYYGGTVIPMNIMQDVHAYARQQDMKVHLDGARLLHACTATGHKPHQYAACADTVSLCFAKGLGAPFGSILVGDKETIETAKIFRKWYGGGLHQAGYMAAAALHGLNHNYHRLYKDHEKARLLHTILARSGVLMPVTDDVPTNMVVFDVAATGMDGKEFTAYMNERGVHLFPWLGTQVRAIAHQDVSFTEVEWAAFTLIQEARNLHMQSKHNWFQSQTDNKRVSV